MTSVTARYVLCLPIQHIGSPSPPPAVGKASRVCLCVSVCVHVRAYAEECENMMCVESKINVCCLSVNALALEFRLAFVLLIRNNLLLQAQWA